MIRCQNCGGPPYAATRTECPHCGFFPPLINELPAWAPDLAEYGSGYDAKAFATLAEHQADNFWFKSRNELIIWAAKTYFPDPTSFLEIGCGTGFVLSGISSAFPSTSLTGTEIFSAGLEFAKACVPSARLMQMDARRIPFDEEFDMAGAFDVIEHIEEDTIVLSELHRALKPKGGLLLTVPQHPWLWSQTDEFAHHKRRYMASELHRKVEAAGFSILRSTSFVSILLPALAVSRILPHLRPNFDPLRELNISRISNVILGEMLSVERWILRQGISLPVGGSRLLVAQKK